MRYVVILVFLALAVVFLAPIVMKAGKSLKGYFKSLDDE